MPLVSVVIPAFNAENTIIETLESVLNQTYKNVEIIIVDDGSTDNTLSVIESYSIDKKSIRFFSVENQGPSAARNYGFGYVQGEFLLFLDADDLLKEDYLEACLAKIEEDPTLDVVYTQIQFFERETGLFVQQKYSKEKILTTNCFPVTALIRSKAFAEIGMYDLNLRFAEDWEMWIRMTKSFGNVCLIERPLVLYRKRFSEDSLTDLNKSQNASDDAHFYIYKKHYDLYKSNGFGIDNLFSSIRYEKKYNNIWYRKLFKKLFKRK